jgi:hypothetical protein
VAGRSSPPPRRGGRAAIPRRDRARARSYDDDGASRRTVRGGAEAFVHFEREASEQKCLGARSARRDESRRSYSYRDHHDL